jgi:hypothetical protein
MINIDEKIPVRNVLTSAVLKTDVCPISKNKLIRKYFHTFAKFTKEISFDKLTKC